MTLGKMTMHRFHYGHIAMARMKFEIMLSFHAHIFNQHFFTVIMLFNRCMIIHSGLSNFDKCTPSIHFFFKYHICVFMYQGQAVYYFFLGPLKFCPLHLTLGTFQS